MPLSEVRQEIDRIDSRLIPLLIERLKASEKVAEIKAKEKIPILNQERENEILNSVAQNGGMYGHYLKGIYAAVFETSRNLQYDFLQSQSRFTHMLEEISSNPPELFDNRKIACQGTEGAYSSIAAKKLFPTGNICYFNTFDDVFTAIQDGRADCGVIPIENSNVGSVNEIFDLLRAHDLMIFAAGDLPVHHCLLGIASSGTAQIRSVCSHPQALSQCSEFLKVHRITPIPCENTAVGAQRVFAQNDPTAGAIASAEAAQANGLTILESEIENASNNTTRFIAVTKNRFVTENADKVSISFSLPHSTGSLHRILAKFSLYDLNLTKIESRPIGNSTFEYYFYLDFMGNIRDKKTMLVLSSVYHEVSDFSLLGNYKEYKL